MTGSWPSALMDSQVPGHVASVLQQFSLPGCVYSGCRDAGTVEAELSERWHVCIGEARHVLDAYDAQQRLIAHISAGAGYRAAQVLENGHGIVAEMATDVLVLFMFGIGTTGEHLRRLGDALRAVADQRASQWR